RITACDPLLNLESPDGASVEEENGLVVFFFFRSTLLGLRSGNRKRTPRKSDVLQAKPTLKNLLGKPVPLLCFDFEVERLERRRTGLPTRQYLVNPPPLDMPHQLPDRQHPQQNDQRGSEQ